MSCSGCLCCTCSGGNWRSTSRHEDWWVPEARCQEINPSQRLGQQGIATNAVTSARVGGIPEQFSPRPRTGHAQGSKLRARVLGLQALVWREVTPHS